jgi:flavin-dependent dehydrogenase
LASNPDLMSDQNPATTCDVTVIGGGLSGKAACLHLAKAGLRVVCIEPEEGNREAVGESLDWSAPDLLSALGLTMDALVEAKMATWKRHVTVKMRDGSQESYAPAPWLGRGPFHVELRTLHVDRQRLDQELLKMTTDCGVMKVKDRVVRVETDRKKISSVHTAGGSRFSSPWFIDASGFATCLLAREFKLHAIQHGPAKVAIWTYFTVPEAVEGTTLYFDPSRTEYLDWIWEIPISPNVASVGYTTSGAAMKTKREQGIAVEDIYLRQLMKFQRFEPLLQAAALNSPNVTSFRSRVHMGTAGPNWLIVGEAASMVDPMTANGVTAALRHAAEASALILKYRSQGALPLRARASYSSRILQMAKFFNSVIEEVVYEPPIRNRIGVQRSGEVYTTPAWSMNLLYGRLRLEGIVSTFLFGLFLGFCRVFAWIFYQLCKRLTFANELPG